MPSLSELSPSDTGLWKLVRDIGKELEGDLRSRHHNVHLSYAPMRPGALLQWDYAQKHHGQLTIVSASDGEGFTIEQYAGIFPGQAHRGGIISLPQDLRTAAQIHDDITAFLSKHYGTGIEREGWTTYHGRLPATERAA